VPDLSAGITGRTARAAVICGYNASIDREWLAFFLTSIRSAGFAGDVHCVGSFDQQELGLLARLRCQAHPQSERPPGIDWENGVHLHMSRVIDQITANPNTRPEYVIVVGTMRAGYLRDPLDGALDSLSLYGEGPASIGESDDNLRWLREFVPSPDPFLQSPIISSSIMEGPTEAVRWFYKLLFAEFVDRMELLLVPKVIQGAFNKLRHTAEPRYPITVHANGSRAYFEIWPCYHDIELSPAIKVGGTTPSVVISPLRPSELIETLRTRLAMQSA
jgi:hypothetical protein